MSGGGELAIRCSLSSISRPFIPCRRMSAITSAASVSAVGWLRNPSAESKASVAYPSDCSRLLNPLRTDRSSSMMAMRCGMLSFLNMDVIKPRCRRRDGVEAEYR